MASGLFVIDPPIFDILDWLFLFVSLISFLRYGILLLYAGIYAGSSLMWI